MTGKGKWGVGKVLLCVFLAAAALLLLWRGVFPRLAAGQAAAQTQAWPRGERLAANLHSTHAVLMRVQDKAILLDKKGEDRIYPASLTKMMTALIVIEQMPNLQEKVTLDPEIFPPLYEQNASMAGFEPGEEVSAADLLYGMMLPSGAECCTALAGRVAGSEEAFVRMMNEKAAQLHLDGTHFQNTSGLQDPDHYSTARDLAVLLEYARQNAAFSALITAQAHATAATNLHPDGITVRSTLFQDLPDPSVPGGRILGGKTGYTDEAGLCLASLAEVDGAAYLLVTAGAPGNHESEPYHIEDARAVYGALGEG